jgi:hypothetical protein
MRGFLYPLRLLILHSPLHVALRLLNHVVLHPVPCVVLYPLLPLVYIQHIKLVT